METVLDENAIGTIVLSHAIRLHRELGPGLLESVYEVLLADALERNGLCVERQVVVPIHFHGRSFHEGFRADVIVQGKVLLEIKSVSRVCDAHRKQVLTYLKLTGLRLGYILNFGASMLKDGIVRISNGLIQANRTTIQRI